MIKALVNQKNNYEIIREDQTQLINNEAFDFDLVVIEPGKFHVLYQNKSYNADLIQANYEEKTFLLKINQSTIEVQLKDRFDLLLQEMGMSSAASNKVNSLKAPMPGLIIDIKVEVGNEVQKGDVLLISEAMKMENVIKAAGNGKIKSIKISTKENVEKGQTLIEFE